MTGPYDNIPDIASVTEIGNARISINTNGDVAVSPLDYEDGPRIYSRASDMAAIFYRIVAGYRATLDTMSEMRTAMSSAKSSRCEWIDAMTMALGSERDRGHLYNNLDTARAAAGVVGLIVACAEAWREGIGERTETRERVGQALASAVDALRDLDRVRRAEIDKLRAEIVP